ncbi:MAG: hypothetical protein GC146_09690 [Limimaricola sp.]|uniref:hypothetical protein n=1 Tax=Limimaricola sp. TaxID=2211665 RepID=UPI001DE9BACB|nr:hypothetical protein [Limimaricola sp.]MBI1417480.1 hypothetical protein [Limimaricola sp.]
MRLVLFSVWKGASAFLTICMMWLALAPATSAERLRLGAQPDRMDLVQMRMARAMMQVAPNFTVARYAEATGMPPETIRAYLTARASGVTAPAMALQAEGPAATAPAVQTRAGGAKFVRVN